MRSGSAFRSVCTLSRPFTGAEAEAKRRAERAGGEQPGKGERRERRQHVHRRNGGDELHCRRAEGGPKGGPKQDTKEEPRRANEQQRESEENGPCGHDMCGVRPRRHRHRQHRSTSAGVDKRHEAYTSHIAVGSIRVAETSRQVVRVAGRKSERE